jgi:hypothetical protein
MEQLGGGGEEMLRQSVRSHRLDAFFASGVLPPTQGDRWSYYADEHMSSAGGKKSVRYSPVHPNAAGHALLARCTA